MQFIITTIPCLQLRWYFENGIVYKIPEIFPLPCQTPIKVHDPIYQSLVFCFSNFGWNGLAIRMYEANLYIASDRYLTV